MTLSLPEIRWAHSGSMSCAADVCLRAGAVAVARDQGKPAGEDGFCGGGRPLTWWLRRGRGCAGVVGGEAQRPCREACPRGAAVRVLRAGVHGGLAGSGDVAGAAAAAGDDAYCRGQGDRGGVLRHGGVPDVAVGAAPAGCCSGRSARRSGPGLGRDRDRGVRAGVLRNQYASMPRCSSITASRCGCRRSAGGWTGMPRIMSRRWWRWGCRRSGRSPGPGSGCVPRWRRRPWSRAGIWAGARRTGTGSRMRGRIRTRRTPRGGGGRTGSSRIRPRHRWCRGCSGSGWRGIPLRGSPGL